MNNKIDMYKFFKHIITLILSWILLGIFVYIWTTKLDLEFKIINPISWPLWYNPFLSTTCIDALDIKYSCTNIEYFLTNDWFWIFWKQIWFILLFILISIHLFIFAKKSKNSIGKIQDQSKVTYKLFIMKLFYIILILSIGLLIFFISLKLIQGSNRVNYILSSSLNSSQSNSEFSSSWLKTYSGNTSTQAQSGSKGYWSDTIKFIFLVGLGNFEGAINFYSNILNNSNYADEFTWNNDIDTEDKELISSLIEKLKSASDKKILSKLYIQKWDIEYGIWNKLYFLNSQKYYLPILYYYSRAIQSYDMSINSFDTADAHRKKGIVMLDVWTVKPKLIYKEFNKAIELNPDDDISYYKLWNMHADSNDFSWAIQLYLSGMKINPNNEGILSNLPISYNELGQWIEAIRVARLFTQKCIEYCNVANYRLGTLLIDHDKTVLVQDVLDAFTHAIEYSSKKGQIYRNAYRQRWKIYFKIDYLDKALDDLIISLNPSSPSYVKDMNTFVLNSDEEESYYLIIKAYLGKWDFDKAKNYHTIAINKFPNNTLLKESNDFFNVN